MSQNNMQKINKSYRRSLHKVVLNHVPQDVIEKGNIKKSWKYGYNAEYDFVVISKDGTLGEIISIEGLVIGLPSVPNKLRFEELPESDQKWGRYKVPADLMFFDKIYKDEKNTDAKYGEIVKKHKSFIDSDFKRKFNGDWFMNDGVPTYITGHYYFFLQHYKLTDMRRYGDFRMPQRDYFIFVEACFADERCLGSLLLKSRRSAFSTSSGSIVINKGITFKNGFFPIVSKKDTDAFTLFDRHIVKPFNELPKHLQPQRVGEINPKKELIFSSPKKKLTTNNRSDISDDGLDTLITFYATTIDAYDGTQVTYSINDEIGKMKGGLDINVYWEQAHKMCHEVGSNVVGKAICGSTANPPHKGGLNYEKFYNNSKLSTRKNKGQTGTGLYALFIPADFSTMGFFDAYGHPIFDNPSEPILNELGEMKSIGVKEYLDQRELDCDGDIQKLNSRKRNNPRVDTDAFLDEDATNMYATEGMTKHITFLKDFVQTDKYKSRVFRFDLYYKPTTENPDNVEIKHTEKGRFVASWLPPKEFRNQFKMKDGRKYPVNGHLGGLGCDPYQVSRTQYGKGSKMGLVGVTSNNTSSLSEIERNKTFVFYNFRPNTIEEAEEDVIKLMLYLSMPLLPETNKDGLVKNIYSKKLRGYVSNNPFKKRSELSPEDAKYGGLKTSPNNKGKQEEVLESYLQSNVHETIDENDIKVPFLDLNVMATEYTDQTRTKLDGIVAWQLACANVSKILIKTENPAEDFNTTHERIIDLFKTEPSYN